MIEFGASVRFRHPLVRSAAYRAGSAADRRAVHRALAEVTDRQLDPDRRAWHRAHAAAEPDEDVAADLERSAERAQSRGGVAAAAAFLERATELTADPARRAARALAAAQAKFEAAAYDAADALIAAAEIGPLDDLQQARLARLRAEIVFARTTGKRRPSAAPRCGQTPRTPRRPTCTRDVPRSARRGDLRRTPRHSPHPPGGRRDRSRSASPAVSVAPDRSVVGRRRDEVHRRIHRSGSAVADTRWRCFAATLRTVAMAATRVVLAGMAPRRGTVGRRADG